MTQKSFPSLVVEKIVIIRAYELLYHQQIPSLHNRQRTMNQQKSLWCIGQNTMKKNKFQ